MTDTPASTSILAPVVSIVDGKPVTTSLDIAKHFRKRHDNVLRAIRSLDCSPEFRLLNFEEVSRTVSQPSGTTEYAMFEITRDGFTFLCMGFTGPEAARWKEAYISAFNAMEQELLKGRFEAQPQPTIGPQDQNMLQIAVKEIAKGDGKQMAAIWSRFNNHFKLGSYKQLLPSQMPDALLYLSGLAKPGSTTLASAIHSIRIAPSDQLLEVVRRNGGNWRWMLTFSDGGHADLVPIPDDACVVTDETLPDMLHQFSRNSVLEAMARMMEKLRRG